MEKTQLKATIETVSRLPGSPFQTPHLLRSTGATQLSPARAPDQIPAGDSETAVVKAADRLG